MRNLSSYVVVFLLGSIGWACAVPAPTPIPGPTNDIEATVEARLQETIQAIPTPTATTAPTPTTTPLPTPTKSPTATPTALPKPVPTPTATILDPYQVIQQSIVKIVAQTSLGHVQGSGVIIGDGEYVITNAHVIDRAVGTIEVSLHPESGPRLLTDGQVVFKSDDIDLALLKIEDSLGKPIEISRTLPNLGDSLILGGFPGIGGETLTATRGTVAGFQFDGATIKFDGQLGSGSSGGAAVNQQGKMVGIATRSSGEASAGSLGILLSAPVVSAALATELLENFRSEAMRIDSQYPLSILGIPAVATVLDGWDTSVTIGYFDMRAPNTTTAFLTEDYLVVGIFSMDRTPNETPKDILDRLIAESEGAYEIVPNSGIRPPIGFSNCVLVHNDERFEMSRFDARGTVVGAWWVSVAGLYSRFCISQTTQTTIIGFVESPSSEVSNDNRRWLAPPTIVLIK